MNCDVLFEDLIILVKVEHSNTNQSESDIILEGTNILSFSGLTCLVNLCYISRFSH